MKVTIECTEEQLELIIKSLEINFRCKMNQMDVLADELAYDTPWRDDEDRTVFERYLVRRDAIRATLDAAGRIAYGDYHAQSSEDCRNVSDIWRSIRHADYIATHGQKYDVWDVRSRPPIQLGTIDLPKVKVEVE